jgi:uncharacterized membrane protein YjgN (DUF898 family)
MTLDIVSTEENPTFRQHTPSQYPVKFTATGSEYFRIWIVNMLLIILTFGIYLPWAKVRRLKYFYNNTQVAGHSLDFHGQASRMLRGTAVVGVFFILYSVASGFSPWAAVVAGVAFLALWPLLFRAAMRFRLSQTSWRGLRFRFTGDPAGAYRCILPPLALILVPVTLGGFYAGGPGGDAAQVVEPPMVVTGLIGLGFLLFALGMPYFLWLLKRYQHGHYAYGPLQTELRASAGDFYAVFIKIIALIVLVVLAAMAMVFLAPVLALGALGFAALLAPLFFLGLLLLNVVIKSYVIVRVQNLVWSRTGNHQLRFKSALQLAPFIGLQFKNYLLIGLTLGFYWPFAVVATMRSRLQAITLFTRMDLDTLADKAALADADATGDAAAELFDLDVGM